jgi:hypothetical protein
MMDDNTKISSKKYKTIGELLKAPIKSIILVSINEKNSIIKTYLFEWLYLNYYGKKKMIGNLTTRIKNISNKPCYYYLVKNIFDNIDILNKNKKTKHILNNSCINFIKTLHTIDPSLCGTLLDYLIRRIICEKTNKEFRDTRALLQLLNTDDMISISDDGGNEFVFDKLPINIKDSYERTKDTKFYKSENILIEIFITSLCHTFSFAVPNQANVTDIINLIQNTPNITEIFYVPLSQFCVDLFSEESNILLNPALGFEISLLDNKRIPSDCDLVINDILYDIKCTKKDSSVYEILQLLGYASLLTFFPKFDSKINNISIINLLQGYIINYDISYITTEQMINYLKILTN